MSQYDSKDCQLPDNSQDFINHSDSDRHQSQPQNNTQKLSPQTQSFDYDDSKLCKYSIYSHSIKLIKTLRSHITSKRQVIEKEQEEQFQAKKSKLLKLHLQKEPEADKRNSLSDMKKQIEQKEKEIQQQVKQNAEIKKAATEIDLQVVPLMQPRDEAEHLLNTLERHLRDINRQKLNNKDSIIQNQPNPSSEVIKVETGTNFFSRDKLKDVSDDQLRQQQFSEVFTGDLTWQDLMKATYRMEKRNFYLTLASSAISTWFGRLTIHIFILFLFEAILQGDLPRSYLFAGLVALSGVIYSYFWGLNNYFVIRISNGFRYGMIYLMIKKIVELPQHSVRKAEIGKVINLISNDLNMMEDKIQYVSKGFVIPFYIVGAITLLIVRYGLAGLAGTGALLGLTGLGLGMTIVNSKLLIKINTQKDQRVKLITEVIEGVKFIKTYAWEMAFEHIISKVRQMQIKQYYWLTITKGIERTVGTSAGNVAGFVIIIAIRYIGSVELNTPVIFAILEVFMYLRVALMQTSFSLALFQESIITLNRYATILNIKPQKMINLDQNYLFGSNQKFEQQHKDLPKVQKTRTRKLSVTLNQKVAVNFKDASIYWNETVPTLMEINLSIPKNSFIGIAGKIGCGKSTLIYSILEEIPYYRGLIKVNGRIGYVEQQPIVFSNTIKQNIIFGKPFNQHLYDIALSASCFKHDLQNFPRKDQTIVGEKGITLSGGQKTRLALARALYTDPEILIMDDPFAAVDVKVGMQIYQEAVLKMKGKRTIILATHHIQYFEQCDEIVFLQNGTIHQRGTYLEIKRYLKNLQSDEEDSIAQIRKTHTLKRRDSLKKQDNNTQDFNNLLTPQQERFVVKWKSYSRYLLYHRYNLPLLIFTLALFVAAQAANVIAYRFLANYDLHVRGGYAFDGDDTLYFLTIGLLFLANWALTWLKLILFYLLVLFSNKQIHRDMILRLMRAPISYFDYTPSGQILSKFSNDFGIMDYLIAFNIVNVLEGITVITLLTANVFEVNFIYFIPSIVGLAVIVAAFIAIKDSIVKIKQLDLVEKSPLFTSLTETIGGLIQIKYYGSFQTVLNRFKELINNSARANYAFWSVSKLLATAVMYVNAITLGSVLFLGIPVTEKEEAGLYALAIVFLLQINDYLGFFLRQITIMESNMISVERAFSIVGIQSEKQFISPSDLEKDWVEQTDKGILQKDSLKKALSQPQIQVNDLFMRYTPKLPFVLKQFDIRIQPGEKVGVVGRTGAGKSSIVQALLRLTEPEDGTLYSINKYNALQMGLHTLRGSISVIPQKSFFFKHTLRKNLDPFDQFSDEEIWNSLRDSNLKETIEQLPQGIETNLAGIQSTFSVGQQQLLSLSRVLLRQNSILILDEATSSVDNETDSFIQKQIMNKFQKATVLTIAHRLTTIANYDKVAVIDKGSIVEYDHPYKLIQSNGIFKEMVMSSGTKRDKIIEIATKAYKGDN